MSPRVLLSLLLLMAVQLFARLSSNHVQVSMSLNMSSEQQFSEAALGTLILCNHTYMLAGGGGGGGAGFTDNNTMIELWLFNLLAFTRVSTIFITFGVFGLALFQREIYLVLVSIGLNADWILNLTLRAIIAQPPPIPGCGPKFSMPSYQCQHTAFLFAIALSFFPLFRVHVTYGALLVTGLLWYWSVFGQVLLRYNTASQAIVGSLIGFAFGIAYNVAIRLFLYKRFNSVVQSNFNRSYFGYSNSL